MKVREAYLMFEIPPNLQEHMLRVGALLLILGEGWQGDEVDREAVVGAGLFHDLANILKFNFDRVALLGEEAHRTNYWKGVKDKVRETYGSDILGATLLIGRNIGLSDGVLRIIEGMEWERVDGVLGQNDFEVALAIYVDMRIGPFGILPLLERIDDLHQRKRRDDYHQLRTQALRLEKIIQNLVSVRVEQISNDQLEGHFEALLESKV